MAAPYRETQHGFTWGPMEVSRLEITKDGHHILKVQTDGGESLDITVSAHGRSLRVVKEGKELKSARND